jgi:hypothetical protein
MKISAMVGGVIAASQYSRVFLDQCEFSHNFGAATAGVILLSDLSILFGSRLLFSYNYASNCGVFRMTGGSFIFLNDTLFENNEA